MQKLATIVLVLLNVLILGATMLFMVYPSWRCVPLHTEPEKQEEQEKEPEMRPAETIQVQVQYGANLVEFDVVLGEREKKDILPPIHYDGKQFDENMIFDCMGKTSTVLFTDCILCSPSFRNCQNASLIMYRNQVYSKTWDSFFLSDTHLPDFYTLTIDDNSLIVRPCPLDETKEFVYGDIGESFLYDFVPKPKCRIIKANQQRLKDSENWKEDQGELDCIEGSLKFGFHKRDDFEFEFREFDDVELNVGGCDSIFHDCVHETPPKEMEKAVEEGIVPPCGQEDEERRP